MTKSAYPDQLAYSDQWIHALVWIMHVSIAEDYIYMYRITYLTERYVLCRLYQLKFWNVSCIIVNISAKIYDLTRSQNLNSGNNWIEFQIHFKYLTKVRQLEGRL